MLNSARDENGAFCAWVKAGSKKVRRSADRRIVAVGFIRLEEAYEKSSMRFLKLV